MPGWTDRKHKAVCAPSPQPQPLPATTLARGAGCVLGALWQPCKMPLGSLKPTTRCLIWRTPPWSRCTAPRRIQVPELSAQLNDYNVPPALGDHAGVLGAMALVYTVRSQYYSVPLAVSTMGETVHRVHGIDERKRMVRYVPAVCLCLLLLWGSTACALKRGESSALSERGYRVSLQVSDTIIFFGLPDSRYPHTAEVVVRVRDAQGQPVDGIAVLFPLSHPGRSMPPSPPWRRSPAMGKRTLSLQPGPRAWCP